MLMEVPRFARITFLHKCQLVLSSQPLGYGGLLVEGTKAAGHVLDRIHIEPIHCSLRSQSLGNILIPLDNEENIPLHLTEQPADRKLLKSWSPTKYFAAF